MFQKIGILIAVIGLVITATRYYGTFRTWQIAREKARKREVAQAAKAAAKAAAKHAVQQESRAQSAQKRASSADDLSKCPQCGSFVPSGVCDCKG